MSDAQSNIWHFSHPKRNDSGEEELAKRCVLPQCGRQILFVHSEMIQQIISSLVILADPHSATSLSFESL